MEQFITTLFTSLGFVAEESINSTIFFVRREQDRAEYYLVSLVNKEILANGMEAVLEEALTIFEDKKKSIKDVEKNTSLIICLKFDNYKDDCSTFKNQLLQIEEDEFVFRKYVIPYTESAVFEVSKQDNIIKSLNQIISNTTDFDSFNNRIFENEAYFFVMQLFIKLPFLNLQLRQSDEFVTIETLLSERIGLNERQVLGNLFKTPQFEQTDRDSVLQKSLDANDKSFDSILTSILGNAQTS